MLLVQGRTMLSRKSTANGEHITNHVPVTLIDVENTPKSGIPRETFCTYGMLHAPRALDPRRGVEGARVAHNRVWGLGRGGPLGCMCRDGKIGAWVSKETLPLWIFP